MNLETKIEAVLFFKGEPVSFKKLEDILKVPQNEIKDAVFNLKNELVGRGVALVENGDQVMLGTAPEFSQLIENLQKEELNKDLSKASLETLSIILYKGGASRAEIDYIRGVNSSFTLRALSVRGLVDKTADEKDSRRYIYKPSFNTLSYLGVRSVEELPEWPAVRESLDSAAKNLEELSAKAEENSNPN
ncbi:SMC-Scp complex subunit ScpB [Candidatus Nomurabacteria bacterium]|nr:SMC-Scp complex subunit ScpB [Candidatus Nomurabacteria bacterium]